MNEMMKQHREKFALLGAFLILAVYVFMGWVLWAPSQEYTQTSAAIKNADAKAKETKTPTLAPIPSVGDVKKQWVVGKDLGAARKGLEWVATYRPKVVPKLLEGPKAETIALYPPKLDDLTVDVGKVNLSWDSDPKCNAQIKNWQIQRKMGDAGKWEDLATVVGSDKSYTDDKTSPKTTYSYRVKAIPEEVQKITENKGAESGEKSIMTPDTTSIRYVGGSKDMAQVLVMKFIDGNWLSQPVNVRPGEKIGKKESRMVEHKMTSLDFTTGYDLIAIVQEPKETKTKKTRTDWVDDPNTPGKKIQKEVEYEDVQKVLTFKIKYHDDAGAEKEMWITLKEKEAPAPPKKPDKPKEGDKPKEPGK